MKKLNIGYAKYFNNKYERKGTLFEGRYKSIPITDQSHFIHIPYYIHLNPLDLIMPEWRKREIGDYKKAMKFLEKYRWSSFPDYIGKKNFPSVTQREFLLEFFEGPENYKKETQKWLKQLELEQINPFLLE
jgi:putative transposase